MPLPKKITFISLEVYGTLIDWESGIYKAFQAEAERDGFTIDRDQLIPLFLETQREIMAGSYELYAEVLRRTAVRVAHELGWELEPVRSSFLPNSIPSWPPFRDTNALLDRLKKKYEIGLISNIDDKLLGATRRHFRSDFDLVVTAQQVRSYKPDPAHFKETQRRHRRQAGLGPHRDQPAHRHPARDQAQHPDDLGQPQEGAVRGQQEAGRRGQGPACGCDDAEGLAMANQTSLVTGVDFITMPTTNFEAAKEFYGTVLGLPCSAEYDRVPGAEFETGTLTFQVIDTNAIGREFKPHPFPIALHVDDVEAARAELESRGVTFVAAFDSGVCHNAVFEDPDGNVLMLHHRYAPKYAALRRLPVFAPKRKPVFSLRKTGIYLITAIVSPVPMAPPSATFSSSTLPARCAVISFSIFIASITQIRAPASTSWPFSTLTRSTVPCSGEISVSEAPSLPPAPRARSRRGGWRRPVEFGRRVAPPVAGGPITLTSKRRPLTSTV